MRNNRTGQSRWQTVRCWPLPVGRQSGIAVLLEHAATDTILKISPLRFSGNGAGIDNCYGQALELSEEIFE